MSPANCDLCGGTEVHPLTVGNRFGRSAPIVQCVRCGLTYQSPRPKTGELESFYRDEYRVLYSGSSEPRDWFVEDQRRRGAEVLQRIRESGAAIPSRVLDLGCGAGGALLPFRSFGAVVAGVEPGPYGGWAASTLALDIRQSLSEVRAGEDFGLVMLSFVLEHVDSPFETLAELHRLLRQDAVVYVEVPNLLGATGAAEDYFHLAHLTYFTPETLRAMLTAAGFEVFAQAGKRGYSVWQLARVVDREPRRPDAWSDPPLDSVEAARKRLTRQRRMEVIDSSFRGAVKPALAAVKALLKRTAGAAAAERFHMSARRAWVRVRSQF